MSPVSGFVVLSNDQAGSTTEEAVERAVGRLALHAPVERRTCAQPEDTVAVGQELNGRVLVVCGGDGTLHTTVAVLWQHGMLDNVVLGLLPLGTGNDFARMMELPLDPEEAAEVIITGVPRTLDLIDVDGQSVVVNVAQAGIGAEASRAATDLKPVLKKLAYPVGTALAGVQAGPWQLRVLVDGTPLAGDDQSVPVALVAVGNGTFVGGGAELVPGSRADDGLLDVVVARPEALLDRAGLAVDVAAGNHPDRDDVTRARGRKVTIAGDPIIYSLDGEITEEVTQRTFTVVPGAWRLLAPAPRTEAEAEAEGDRASND